MSTPENAKQAQELQSGADHVDQTEQLAHGYSAPHDASAVEVDPEDNTGAPVKTELPNLTLTMFTQGSQVRVRVGNAHNAAELYERAFDSADEANNAMLDAGILTQEQIADMAEPAGTGIPLTGTTLEQLEEAGLQRHNAYTG